MNIVRFLFVSILLSLAQTSQLPPSQSVNDLVFFQKKLFFLTSSRKYFGFIQYQTGYFLMQQKVNEDEEVIGLDGGTNFFALRKERNKAFIFDLEHVSIQQINVQIRFRHQKVIDLLKINDELYVLTNKDFRKYKEDQQMSQDSKFILTSCRKNQWFLKFFQYGDKFRIILVRQQQICLRIVQQGQKPQQKCLFNISSEPHQISRISNGILIRTQSINTIIKDDLEVFSFQGNITQINHRFVTFSDQFKSFDLQKYTLVDGLDVHGSSDKYPFFMMQNQSQDIVLTLHGKNIETIGQQQPKRSWINQKDENTFLLVLQYQENKIQFKTISLAQNSSDQKDSNDPDQL